MGTSPASSQAAAEIDHPDSRSDVQFGMRHDRRPLRRRCEQCGKRRRRTTQSIARSGDSRFSQFCSAFRPALACFEGSPDGNGMRRKSGESKSQSQPRRRTSGHFPRRTRYNVFIGAGPHTRQLSQSAAASVLASIQLQGACRLWPRLQPRRFLLSSRARNQHRPQNRDLPARDHERTPGLRQSFAGGANARR